MRSNTLRPRQAVRQRFSALTLKRCPVFMTLVDQWGWGCASSHDAPIGEGSPALGHRALWLVKD
jgi:hypothetical protein